LNARKGIALTDAIGFVDSTFDEVDCVNYGTGENPLAPEWFSLISHVSANFPHVRQGVTTNGSLSLVCRGDDDKLRRFIESVSEVDISVDYADRRLHNRMRGVDSAYSWAMDTLALCREYGKVPTIVMVGMEDTLEPAMLAAMCDLANDHDAFLRINILRPIGKAIMPPSFDSLRRALDCLEERMVPVAISDPPMSLLLGIQSRPDASGKTSFRILPNGDITPSTYLLEAPWVDGNIASVKKIEDIVRAKSFSDLSAPHIPRECRDCEFVDQCEGGAIDRRWLWYRDLDQRDPYCPRSHGVVPKLAARPCSPRLSFDFVHDGYLPTMIFASERTICRWSA